MGAQGTTSKPQDAVEDAHSRLIRQADEKDRRAALLEQAAEAERHTGKKAARFKEAAQLRKDAESLRGQAKRYPRQAGHRGVATSKAAAALVNKGLKKRQSEVLDLLRDGPATNSELFQRLSGLSDAAMKRYAELRNLERGIQPRSGELNKLGLVVDTQERRPGPTGNDEIVWAVASHVRQERT